MDKIRDLRDKYFQVDDEYLNGYAKLCGISATGVYLSLCRHANKQQQCFPSKKLISEEMAISERTIYSALKKLEEWNIIITEEQGKKEDGSFKNKLYTLLDKKFWKDKPQATIADGKTRRQPLPSANNDTHRRQPLPNKETHINQTQEDSEQSSRIQEIISLFGKINPTINYGNKTQRSAVIEMIKKMGWEKTKKMTEYAISVQGAPYSPTITTPYQLKNKIGDLRVFYKKENGNR